MSKLTKPPLDAEDSKSGIQVLSRTVAILRTLAGRADDGLSLSAIAQRTNLPRSTVQRIIEALHEEGLVAPSVSGTGSCLGPTIAELAVGMTVQPIDRLRNEARRLVDVLDETIALCVFDNEQVVVIETLPSRQPLQVVLHPTLTHVGLFTSAAGKAILSGIEPQHASLLIAKSPATERDRLTQEIKVARVNGYATDDEEEFAGVSAIAAPIHAGGKVYALVLVAPSKRFEAERQSLLKTFRSLEISSKSTA